jgi:hypothetical protein
MAAAAAPAIPGWLYVDFYYGPEDWVRRFVYVVAALEAESGGLQLRLVRIEEEEEEPVRTVIEEAAFKRMWRGRRTGAGEFYLVGEFGGGLDDHVELTHVEERLPTLAAVAP